MGCIRNLMSIAQIPTRARGQSSPRASGWTLGLVVLLTAWSVACGSVDETETDTEPIGASESTVSATDDTMASDQPNTDGEDVGVGNAVELDGATTDMIDGSGESDQVDETDVVATEVDSEPTVRRHLAVVASRGSQ